ncbi:putative Glycosyl transferase [Candidatus Hydrogenisulfobacillus filiaventi]|uniref:Putative Glycosyl transferase n=1 Tax=Candidatus Hydrogenisulfobacillus filiaventi TaxID=2707344 RepID=A0A6F8ZE02_9FIRM|nr:glycosyltransferase [Bacillota bacterium]CAB1127682.1 putative Glycosyl transferase [Candidatus Hydrogenisulfobacillus filiaventi]
MDRPRVVPVRHLLRYPVAEPGGVSSMLPAWVAWANRQGTDTAWVDPPSAAGEPAPVWIRRYAARLAHLSGPVLAHAHHPWAALAWTAAWGTGPAVLTVHGVTDLGAGAALLLREAAAGAGVVTVPSRALAARLATWGIRARMLPNAYDTRRFVPLPEALPWPPLRLVVVARLVPEKGVDTALEAAARLEAAGRTVRLDIVGDGPLRPQLEGLGRRLGLGGRVRFHGFSPRPEQWLCRAHILLLPSRAEAFGNVIVEAGACGVPAVASRTGGIPEQVQDGITGLLVPPDNPDALAAAVLRLAADRRAWEGMRRAARRQALRFDLDVVLPRWQDLYRSLGASVSAGGQAP